ncbi:M20/M25/M40 family metallo-hydrolase [Sphingomonas naphthae]|uniref:Carboxypeptidase Q n=1 Tax=Sphingomonas naphthae TaxID=1813468 RepID=A0ABY7TPK5_9SPHN|nr:M20/M25/M40 family metallo-hydrolase [Sphingomonas naphthae]WCT74865.1 M20/M25/M40 family metallo-hydrolase [Sphingomonas naphthae]
MARAAYACAMRTILPALSALLLATTATAAVQPDKVATMRDAALKDDIAYDITEGLTTEVGQRLAGTEAEARARVWAARTLKSLGFANVRTETFDMPVWVRGAETAEVTAPFAQKLVLTALGNSGATPAAGIDAEVIGFASLDELRAAPAAQVANKIVFVTHDMKANQDGSGYGYFGAVRRNGPSVASAKGAAAILIKSIGTDHHRVPHTGVQNWTDGVKPIPAAALSVPDAEQLSRILSRGQKVTIHLTLTPRDTGIHQSGNVIAEVPGRDPRAPIILIGGHLDSWDLGTGAIDDAAGLAITTAAARRFLATGAKPLRTIRLVWFGAEEVGGFGGEAYAKAHANEKHELVAEADFGGDRVWRMQATLAPAAKATSDQLMELLAPLGVTPGRGAAHGGTDVEPTANAQGTAIVDLGQDGTRYFDLHHTADDTFDKIEKPQMQQAVAAWTAMLGVVANTETPLAPGAAAKPQ